MRIKTILCLLLSLLTFTSFSQDITVSGLVMDSVTKETLIGAIIFTKDRHSVTDNDGRYSIMIPQSSRDSLTCAYLGYESKALPVSFVKDTTIVFMMEKGDLLPEARVFAFRDQVVESSLMSVVDVPVHIVKSAPVLMGEADVLKTLQLLPGIQSGMDGTSGIFVRGGGADENLYLLDGIPMYNVSHLLGVFSAFTPEAVKKVTLYKGVYPSRYGGRVSGVVDVRTNDGNADRFHGMFSIGTLTDKVHFEGPIGRGNTTYSFTGRALHTFLFYPILNMLDIGYNYYFYDVNAKLTHRFSNSDKLSISAYTGKDVFGMRVNDNFDYQSIRETDVNWGNTVAALRWNHVFSGNLSSNLSVYGNFYNMDSRFGEDVFSDGQTLSYNSLVASGIKDYTVSYDMDYIPSTMHYLRMGTQFTNHHYAPQTRYDTKSKEGGMPIRQLSNEKDYFGLEAALYLEDDITLTRGCSIHPGLRLVVMTTEGRAYGSVEPRFSSKYSFDNGLTLKASYSRISQYVHLLSTTNFSMPTDIWVPITNRIKPVFTNHVSIGAYYDKVSGWDFSAEAYYKHSDNVLDYRDGISMFGTASGWDEIVEMGEARSYGLELFVKKTSGPTTGWLSYTLSKTERRYPDGYINNGQWYPFKYDRRHVFSLLVKHVFSNSLNISASWSIMSGAYLTIPDRATVVAKMSESVEFNQLNYSTKINIVDHVPQRSNYHLPPSHCLNVSLNLYKEGRHGKSLWSFGVYNLYNQMNPNLVYVEPREERELSSAMRLTQVTFLPILPSVNYSYYF